MSASARCGLASSTSPMSPSCSELVFLCAPIDSITWRRNLKNKSKTSAAQMADPQGYRQEKNMPKGVCIRCNGIFDTVDDVVECTACGAVMKVTGWKPIELELIESGAVIARR